MTRTILTAGAALAALTCAASASASNPAELRLENVAARVVVTLENRADVAVEVRPGRSAHAPTPAVSRSGGSVTVSTPLKRDAFRSCHTRDGRVKVAGHVIADADLPVIYVRAPMDLRISSRGAIRGEAGDARTLDLSTEQCATWRLGDVAGRLVLDLGGMGDVSAGRAGDTTARVSGMGDVKLTSTRALDARLSGMSDVNVGSVAGPVDATLSGMGDLRIRGGEAPVFNARLSGMGEIRFDGTAGDVDARASGMGTITVARATGTVTQSKSGMASIKVGR